MYTPEKIQLFIRKVNKLRFLPNTKENRNKYKIIYLPENIKFDKVYPLMNLYKQDIRRVVNPRLKISGMGTININTDTNKAIKKLGLLISVNRKSVENTNQNYIIDTTEIIKKIITVNKRNFISSVSNRLYTSLLDKLVTPLNKNKKETTYKNIIMYCMDVGSPIEPDIKRRVIFPLLFFYIRNKIQIPGIDYIFLCLVNSKKPDKLPVYIKIYDSNIKGNFYSRIMNIFKSIKLDNTEIENYVDDLSQNIIKNETDNSNMLNNIYQKITNKKSDEVTDVEKYKINNKISSAISIYLKDNPENTNLFTDILGKKSDSVNELILKHAIIATATIYAATRNKEKSDKILKIGLKSSKKTNTKLKNNDINIIKKFTDLTDTYIDRVIDKFTFQNLSQDPLISKLDLPKIVDDKVPDELFYKKQYDYTVELKNDIIKLFKQFETKQFPLKLISIKASNKQNENEIKKTVYMVFDITLQDDKGKQFNIQLMLPSIDSNGNFLINGHKKLLINQLILKPVYFPKPRVCKITSFFSTVTIENRYVRQIYYLRIYLVGLVLSMYNYLAYTTRSLGGPDYIFKRLGLTYQISDNTKETTKIKRSTKNNWYINFFNQGTIFFNKAKMESSPLLRSLYYGMKMVNYKRLKITLQQFLDPNFQSTIIILGTGKKNAPYRLDNLNAGFLDQVTKELLENDNYPTKLLDLFWWAMEKVQTDYVDVRTDLSKQRVRSTEVFTHGVYKQLLIAYNQYLNKRLSGIEDANFEIDPMHVFKQIANSQLVRMKNNINPMQELTDMSRTTLVGLGGIANSNGATGSLRTINDSYFGTLAPADTPEGGAIGILNQLTVNSSFKNTRGELNLKQINNNEKAGLLSVSGAIVPFCNHNDGARMMMATNQTRQIVSLMNPEPPLVQTGYETILASFLSDAFLKRSPFNGTIVEVTNNYIMIKEKSKQHQKENKIKIDLQPVLLPSGQGIHGVSYFNPKVKVGQKIKYNQVIAEGATMVDSTISLGRNLLVGYMPYKGYNFEDGIVINSKLLKQKRMISKHLQKIEFHIPENSKILSTPGNDPNRKDISSTLEELFNITNDEGGIKYSAGDTIISYLPKQISEMIELDIDEMTSDGIILIKAPYDGRIIDIEVSSNESIDDHPKLKKLFLTSNQLKKSKGKAVIPNGKYKLKDETFKGTIINILYEYKDEGIILGNKYCNRHGNKGTICYIEDKMPITPWGEELDIIFNPLGIISRMNIGQILELYCGLICRELRNRMVKNSSKKNVTSLLKNIYQDILDNSPKKVVSKSMIKIINNMSTTVYKKWFENNVKNRIGFSLIFPTFNTPTMKDISKVLIKLKLKDSYILDLPSYGPGVKTKFPVAVGYLYIYKLEHMAKFKLSSRSTAKYSSKTMQPTVGKKNIGGQRFGEFDSWALFSYGAKSLIKEFYSLSSDDVSNKNKVISDIIQDGLAHLPDEAKTTPTKDLLEMYIKMMMLDIQGEM